MPELVELDLSGTAYEWRGKYCDGGYLGDGILSGHQTNDKPNQPVDPVNPSEKTS